MEGWKDGRVEGWKGGRMDGWKDGRVERWNGGRMEGWKDGWMERWKGGKMEGWKDGRVEGWKGGKGWLETTEGIWEGKDPLDVEILFGILNFCTRIRGGGEGEGRMRIWGTVPLLYSTSAPLS
jgi:hypothetical protein